MSVYSRWRPLEQSQQQDGEIERTYTWTNSKGKISLIARSSSSRNNSWSSASSFTEIFETDIGNGDVFKAAVSPNLPRILEGATCNFFAYGHTGSGKTHTIIGNNDYNDIDRLGLYLFSARWLCEELTRINSDSADAEKNEASKLGVGIRLYELRHSKVYDLLDDHKECHVREGEDGKTHIRGETEMLEGGKVRVKPIVQKICWNIEEIAKELQAGLQLRATGTSTVHDQSSRTHAVLEMEVITQDLVNARNAVVDAQSELVPVGKLATDIYLEETMKALMKNDEGQWVSNPAVRKNQERIDAAEAEKKKHEGYVEAAEQRVAEMFTTHSSSCLGGKIVFVDLAGAEFHNVSGGAATTATRQTPQQRQEGRQINSDLLALKEVIRAWSSKQPRIPFRSSTLTMVLREHFLGSASNCSGMILTVSPANAQFSATKNTLTYGNLVGAVA